MSESTAPPTADDAGRKPALRGLWGLMRAPASDADPPETPPATEVDEGNEPSAAASESRARPGDAERRGVGSVRPVGEADAPRRSLWEVMRGPSAVEAPSAPPAAGDPVAALQSEPTAAPRGLWALMGRPAENPTAPPVDVETDVDDAKTELAQPDKAAPPPTAEESARPGIDSVGSIRNSEPFAGVEPPPHQVPAIAPPIEPVPAFRPAPVSSTPLSRVGAPASPVRSRGAVLSLVAGGASIPLAALAFLPDLWTRFPATVAGFTALAAGFSAWGEIGRSRGRKTGRGFAGFGLACGLVGMFLGPLAFARLGDAHRQASGRSVTRANLERLGSALSSHHEAKGRFPSGGVFRKDPDGRELPLHGWMASLLPWLGEQALHDQIDFRKPYDDEANREPMSRDVPAFLSATGDRAKVGRGFAPAHYAGVGGELVIPGQGLVHLGIFDKNSSVRRQDVVDGLSSTLVAGEISHFFPPWGEPENWRQIGGGINRQPRGFGNADGTGAFFLKADGSVQFFATGTSRDVLEKLSTRDGAEPIQE